MAFTTIIFNARDAWSVFIYGFKINMLTAELSIEYKNVQGGFTTKGIKLNEKQFKQMKRLLSEQRFQEVVSGKWKEERTYFALDPNMWELDLISDDGHPLISINNGFGEYQNPISVIELVEYVLRIMTHDDLSWRAF